MATNDRMIAYLLSESETVGQASIVKMDKDTDTVIIDAILQDTDFNRNKRLYSKEVLNQGLNSPNVIELLSKKAWVGEAGHPVNPTLQRQMTILPDNISHRILNWRWEGGLVKGNVESLPTPRGRDFRDLIRINLETSFSLRALGPVTKTPNGMIVGSPLQVLAYDWVFIPSHMKAYQEKIIQFSTLNPNQQSPALTESYCIALAESSAVDYIKDKSENYRLVSELYEFGSDAVMLSEDFRTITISDKSKGKDKLVIGVETFLSREIDNYMSKLR